MNTDDTSVDVNATPWMIRQQAVSDAAKPVLKSLEDADKGDVKKIAATQIELLSKFYDLSLSQSSRSFRAALIASIVGLIFFLVALGFMLTSYNDAAIISAAGGVMVQFIAGVNFVLYGKTLDQLSVFQSRLESTQRFLLANSLCENLTGKVKEYTRARLIGSLSGISDGGDMARDLVATVDVEERQGNSGLNPANFHTTINTQPTNTRTPHVVLDPAVDPTMNDTIPVIVPADAAVNPQDVSAAIAGRT